MPDSIVIFIPPPYPKAPNKLLYREALNKIDGVITAKENDITTAKMKSVFLFQRTIKVINVTKKTKGTIIHLLMVTTKDKYGRVNTITDKNRAITIQNRITVDFFYLLLGPVK